MADYGRTFHPTKGELVNYKGKYIPLKEYEKLMKKSKKKEKVNGNNDR